MSYRVKLAVFALGAVVFLFILDTAFEALQTLRRLDAVEAERDQWQRPADIISALSLRPGSTVVDLGCGSGYFTLKLSPAVGASGRVYAVDIRRLPLTFLWVRALIGRSHNITTVLGQHDNSRLPSAAVDAVLIVNTYHELSNRGAILDQVFKSLVSGGRLAIVDPMQTERGEISTNQVEDELRGHGFDIVNRDGLFIDQPIRGVWWRIIARRP